VSDPRRPLEPGCRAFEHVLAVRPADVDAAGHLNHVRMLAFFEFARVRAHREVRERFPELPDMDTVVRHLSVDYLGQAEVFEELRVRSWVRRDGGSSRTWLQELVRPEGRVICRAEVTSVLVRDGRAARLPALYRASFADHAEAPGP
jgi:YbgC/YbaW family acyl-CoA thioester hydrolase